MAKRKSVVDIDDVMDEVNAWLDESSDEFEND